MSVTSTRATDTPGRPRGSHRSPIPMPDSPIRRDRPRDDLTRAAEAEQWAARRAVLKAAEIETRVRVMQLLEAPGAGHSIYVTAYEICCAGCISKSTLFKHVAEGRIRRASVQRMMRFSVAEARRYLQSGRA